ncbi:flavin-containing monooxygenase [Tardiphaga sp.]|jgi:cation diffusion facilitator CzcD-associated flavoprotein CzcO|uniref:flavin-containing monooxygenase n=1 Tax=Tardiphaga sp. TaxID=1926292 RepID=UPI0037DA5452
MNADQAGREHERSYTDTGFDAVVIGAGVAGLYQLYKLREIGLRVRIFETGSAVGGTWYWNRYPGARFDSESWTYGYSFSKELLEEWTWEEHFSAQPDTERYLNYVADKFDLRRDIQFNSRVVAALWREDTRSWDLTLENGARYSTRFLVTAIGVLSASVMPTIPGIESFAGQSCHTHSWPKEGLDLAGKRVGIIGTGATAVQTIQTIAKTVGHLTVFQRTPNWVFPLNNSKITAQEMQDIRARYPDILARCRETPGCYVHGPDPRKTLEVSPEDREAFWEKLYRTPGFGQWQANFSDMLTDRTANALASDFAARKIRERVNDPIVAEKLIPKNHGFGTRRIPLESGYYEVYNQPNVQLVDVNETPIERITPHGLRTSDCEYEFDVIIFATGFDAITGAFDRIDIRGVNAVRLKEVWMDGPQTYLGVFVEGFPNFLMAMGPHAGLSNYTRTAEYSVEWITDLVQFATERGLSRIEATPLAVQEWTDHVLALGQGQLMNEVGSWMTGVNRNIEGKQKPRIMRYSGGHPAYREYCDAVAAEGYPKLAY